MRKKEKNKSRKINFCVRSFHVKGLTEHQKKEELVRDTNKNNVDACCLQEIKIKDASSYGHNDSSTITFHSDNDHYGSGFVLAKK